LVERGIHPASLPDTPKGALSEHLAADGGASEAPHLDGSNHTSALDDDPGLWDLEDLEPERLKDLVVRIEAEQLSEFNLIRIL
jgi:hypothetical protein